MSKKSSNAEDKKKIIGIIENIDSVDSISELEVKLDIKISFDDVGRVIKTMENKHRSLIGWKNHYDKENDHLSADRCRNASKEMKRKLEIIKRTM